RRDRAHGGCPALLLGLAADLLGGRPQACRENFIGGETPSTLPSAPGGGSRRHAGRGPQPCAAARAGRARAGAGGPRTPPRGAPSAGTSRVDGTQPFVDRERRELVRLR